MTVHFRSAALCGASLAGLLLLSACGKSEPAATPPATPPAASSAPAAPATDVPANAGTAAAVATPATSSSTSPSDSAAPAAADTLAVAKLTLGSAVNAAHQITRASTSFPSSEKTIYASVATTGNSDGATLNAKWTYLEGKSQLVSSISQSIATEGPAVTTFKVQNPDLWPEGKYQVEISLDGKPVTKQEFEIKKS